MIDKVKSIRPFIGAKDYGVSRAFYTALGFTEVVIDNKMSLFRVSDAMGFYLQNAYVKDWIDNSMVFLEVKDLDAFEKDFLSRKLKEKFPTVRFSKIVTEYWGREMFVHDPSGVLWHFGEFRDVIPRDDTTQDDIPRDDTTQDDIPRDDTKRDDIPRDVG